MLDTERMCEVAEKVVTHVLALKPGETYASSGIRRRIRGPLQRFSPRLPGGRGPSLYR
jgi:hypothetical protein